MIKKILLCDVCGSTSFSFRWEFEEKNQHAMILNHPGIGYQIQDSIITCTYCGISKPYHDENFLSVEDEVLE